MAITLVQSIGVTGGSGTSITATLGSNTTAGNCIIVAIMASVVSSASSVTLGGSAGNFAAAVTSAASSSFNFAEIWADPNCAGGQTNVAVNWGSSANADLYVYEVSGLAGSSAVDKTNSNATSSSSTSWTSNATATTTKANEFWVGCMNSPNTNSMTVSGAWTVDQNDTSHASVVGHQIVSSTGTATFNGTVGSSTVYAAAVATFLPFVPSLSNQSVQLRQAVRRSAYF